MTEEIKVQDAGASDKVKLVVAILIVAAGVVGFYVLSGQAAWVRWLAVVAGLLLAAVIIAYSGYGSAFSRFVTESRGELRKIVWPTRQETGMTTLAVFVFVTVAGLFFWGLDVVLAWATRALTGQGG